MITRKICLLLACTIYSTASSHLLLLYRHVTVWHGMVQVVLYVTVLYGMDGMCPGGGGGMVENDGGLKTVI